MFDLLRNRNFARADVPRWLLRRDIARLATWGALAAELVFGPALLFAPTAACACVAAIVFHLVIARLVDVYLYSAVMIAALVACWPIGAGTLPVPPLDLSLTVALVLALGYLAWAVLADLAVLDRLGVVRGWRMFTTSTPVVVGVEIAVLDASGTAARWAWGHLDDPWKREPARRGHRFQRFQFALLRDAGARRRLADRFGAALPDLRAWSVDVVVRGVHDEAIVAAINIGAGAKRSGLREREILGIS
jgi:hypothetical protein